MKNIVKNNAGAFITAIIILLLIGNYIFFIIPGNEKRQDSYNKSLLEQFNKQFNTTLKDYANAINRERMDSAIVKQLRKFRSNDSIAKAVRDFSGTLLTAPGAIQNGLILKNIRVTQLENGQNQFTLVSCIHLGFDLSRLKISIDTASPAMKRLSAISYSSTIDKLDLKTRLLGAAPFDKWIVYTSAAASGTAPAKDGSAKSEVLVNNGVDIQESDSLKVKFSKQGVATFRFSDKRFYKRSFNIEGTGNYVTLVGAVSEEAFRDGMQTVDPSATLVAILLVILLFLCIPLLKPLISSSKENLSQLDFLSVAAAIGLISVLLSCFLLVTFLSVSTRRQLKPELTDLNKNVQQGFKKDLDAYKDKLSTVKLFLGSAYSGTVYTNIWYPALSSGTQAAAGTLASRFQNFFLIDHNGDLIKDMSNAGSFAIRKNFSDRDYFKVLQGGDMLYKDVLTAVYSKNDNIYKIVYAQRWHRDSVLGLVYAPEIKKLPMPPSDRGYLVCDKTGLVLLHNNPAKSLNENLQASYKSDYSIQKLFHGFSDSTFCLNYDGSDCLFYCKELSYSDKEKSYPLYVLTYKKIRFEERLKVYTFCNGILISIIYFSILLILGYLYSTIFYYREIRSFSRFHIRWLFPDNSRMREYCWLMGINALVMLFFLFLFWQGGDNILYPAMINGVNLLFLHFVVLNQRFRFFLKNSKTSGTSWLFVWLLAQEIAVFIFPFGWRADSPIAGLGIVLVSQFVYLRCLKLHCLHEQKTGISQQQLGLPAKRKTFAFYMLSNIAYHYFAVPFIILLTLFCIEKNKYDDFISSASRTGIQAPEPRSPYMAQLEDFFYTVRGMEPPTLESLGEIKFDRYRASHLSIRLADYTWLPGNANALSDTIWLIVAFLLLLFVIFNLINFHSGHFFFFDLSEAYRLGYFKRFPNSDFKNTLVVMPPYHQNDIEQLDLNEQSVFDKANQAASIQWQWLKKVKTDKVSNLEQVEIISINNVRHYLAEYRHIWEKTLSPQEQQVLLDFSEDFFVNYKNKEQLLSLMEKGLIIADPLTGRLRTMNFGFRSYIQKYAVITMPAREPGGNYSKWRIPLLIVATSGLLLIMYLNKEGLDKILLVAGSIITTVGLVTKFLDMYKKPG